MARIGHACFRCDSGCSKGAGLTPAPPQQSPRSETIRGGLLAAHRLRSYQIGAGLAFCVVTPSGRSAALHRALLALVFLVTGCTTQNAMTTGQTSSPPETPTWVTVPYPVQTIERAALSTSTPKRITDRTDLCELLAEQEIVSTAKVPFARHLVPEPGERCRWRLSDTADAKGLPVDTLVVQAHPATLWLGTEQASIDGHPTRRRGGDGICILRVALHQPNDDDTDRPVLGIILGGADTTADVCPAAQTLAELALDRLPTA